MFILEAIHNSAIGEMMRVSPWGYPIALILHGLGMAIVVGLAVLVSMRILGAFRAIPGTILRPILALAVIGFAINFLSGVALFTTEPVRYISNVPFVIKIIAIIIAMTFSIMIYRSPDFRNFQDVQRAGVAAIGGARLRNLAIASLAAWVISMLAGRLIAYIL